MSRKDKHLEWPSDSDLDDLSIRSSELSDLDSDVDSLGSIIRCVRVMESLGGTNGHYDEDMLGLWPQQSLCLDCATEWRCDLGVVVVMPQRARAGPS